MQEGATVSSSATRLQRSAVAPKDVTVGGVVEVAEADEPVDHGVELGGQVQLAQVAHPVVHADTPGPCPLLGQLDEVRRPVDPHHAAAALRQPLRDPAVTARGVEHAHVGLEVQQTGNLGRLDV